MLPRGKIIHFGHKSPRYHEKTEGEIRVHTFQEENERYGSFSSAGPGVPMMLCNITQASQSHTLRPYSLDVPLSAEGKICKHIWQWLILTTV